MKTSLLYLLVVFIFILASCSPPEYRSYSAKTNNIYGPGVMQLPVVAELDVSDKRVETSITRKNTGIEKMKIEAVDILMDSLGFDILVEPRYSSKTKSYTTTLTASGFPATYYNFHTLDTTEVALLEAGILHVVPTKESSTDLNNDKKRGGGTFLAILAVAATVVLNFLI